ncbi:recombinase rad51 [Perkinsus chesapeaki]|uniref:Recombinase rad51 n=1 Tax=Perkinsus chesapeaki TaxID=330153 RepID=A0A7J6KPH8_PERCH|nr:recombinase rad51 [Perkinsus chesapeaki]
MPTQDKETVLSNVVYARAYNSDHQQQLLLDAASVMCASRYALVVVDSVTNLLRSEFQGRGELAERQQLLGRLLRMLQRMADEYGVAVVITNQVVANVDPGERSPYRRFTIIRVYDSPCLPEAECAFSITANGLADYVKPQKDNNNHDHDKKGYR